ncbi:hypothetical protein IKF87_01385 [Candidatus Saccharibacteria bacterium]|nr:hypothetical protein [Candidatus Saccharibacteria bacterium]
MLCFCIGIAPISIATHGEKAYADNTTNITFEVTAPDNHNESDYEDIEGEGIVMWEAGQDWVIGRSSKAVVTFYLARENFVGLSMDDQELTEGQEFSISGNTTITFKKSYLDTLSEGRHDIIARFSGIDETEENSLFDTYLTVYTEESATAAGITVPNTGFFAAIGEIASGSLPVVSFVGIAVLCIIICIKFYAPIKKAITRFQKNIRAIFKTIFRRLTQRYIPTITKRFHRLKPSNQFLKFMTSVLIISAVSGGFGILFHQLSHKQSDAASTINLEVGTSSDIKGTILYNESIARAVDTIDVNTEPGVEYDIYMSAGSDNHLHANGTDKTFGDNTNLVSLSDGSWGFTTENNSSIYTTVPKKGEEVLVAHASEPGETTIYFAAKSGEGFAAGSYSGTVRYTIIAKSGNPMSVTPGSGGASNTLTITTPIAKNGDMSIDTPTVKIGEEDCLSPTMQATDNRYITITCNVPDNLAPGNYSVSLDFSDIEQELSVEDGYIEPEPTPEPTPDPEPDPNPDPTPDPGPAPEPEPDPEPEPEITYYTVTSGPSNPAYGSTNRTSTSVAAGTTFTSSGNTLTFSDGRTITATPKSVTGYTTSCSGWIPASGTVNSNMTVTANCTATIIQYKVTVKVNNTSYGTANASEIWIPYNTTFTSSGNTMTFSNGRTIKATPTSATGYTTTCSGWTPASGTVTSNITVTANCTRSTNNYTMTFKVNDSSLGTVSASSALIPYNTTYSSSGATLTFANGTKVTASAKTITGYTVTCSGWSPSSGKVTANTTFTASCTKKAVAGTITYKSSKGASTSCSTSKTECRTIKPLKDFAGVRYSNDYDSNDKTYTDWTKKDYYFDYWEGSDGNVYVPEGAGYTNVLTDNGYKSCQNGDTVVVGGVTKTCKTSYQGSSGLVLQAHYSKMNNINRAAIALAWPSEANSSGNMITTDKPAGWSQYVTLASPYNYKIYRYRVASTQAFRTAAKSYYTDSYSHASTPSSNSNKCDNYQSLGCNTSKRSGGWNSEDLGYRYARSCDRFAAISIYQGIMGYGKNTTTYPNFPFNLSAQSRHFYYDIKNNKGKWTAVNTGSYTPTDGSDASNGVSGTYSNMGQLQTHYYPGDIRLVYGYKNEKSAAKHDTYVLSGGGNKYYLRHIAVYVKTEDGVSHIAEAGHSTYAAKASNYKGDFIFATTAMCKKVEKDKNDKKYCSTFYEGGGGALASNAKGSFGHLSSGFYNNKYTDANDNEYTAVNAIWRYQGSGN